MIRKYLRPIAAAFLLVGALAVSAVALNVDQNRTFSARVHSTQQTSYYRVTVNFNDPNISTAQQFGALPAGAFITAVKVEVVTLFNAATTNVLTIGTTTTANEIVNAADINEAATGVTDVTRGLGRSLTTGTSDIPLYAKYTQSGTAATTGQAVIVISFVQNNDL